MVKAAAVRRSACDQCRAKRVRCLRAENSMATCARCSHVGAWCVTSASGHPGRPRKPRPVDGDSTLRGHAASPADVSSPRRHRASTLRDTSHVKLHAPAMAGEPALARRPQPAFWETPADSSVFFDSPSIVQSPASGEDNIFAVVVDHLSTCGPSQLQGPLSPEVEPNAILHTGQDSSTALDVDVDPLLDLWADVVIPSPLPQCFSATTSLVRFREEMDQRIAAVDEHFSDPIKVLQGCSEEEEEEGGGEVENPAALLLTCSKEFIDIIQSLTAEARPATSLSKDSSYRHNGQLIIPPDFAAPAAMHTQQTEDALSTEIVLLALSSYLALMRLYDSVFHCLYQCLCQMPPDALKSVTVKSVLRIGGISSLQDIPLKTYATGILDTIQSQIRTLERCMGVPTEYCLSGEAAAAATPGMFSRADRAQLFRTVMAQEDVTSRRGDKSYVESIRASIQGSVGFLEYMAT